MPLYWLLFWSLFTFNHLNLNLIIGLDIFFIIHFFLHLLYLKHPRNEFTSVLFWVIISGAGLAGLLDLAFIWGF